MARRVLCAWFLALGLAAALIGSLATSPVWADGDPASDVLLGQNVFYPYSPPVLPAVQKRLDGETAAAKRGGFPIKVALIASPVDLGVIPALFGHPQKYADFLDQEISFQTRQPLLVVMAAGYGVQGVAREVSRAALTLAKPAGTTSTDLARAAVSAVARLGAAEGHPIKGVSAPPGGSTSGSSIALVLALAAAAALIAAVLLFLRSRPRSA